MRHIKLLLGHYLKNSRVFVADASLLVYVSQEGIKMLSTTQKDCSMEAAVLNSASARNESCYS